MKVGVIGLGIMGSAMSANLAKNGFKVYGYDVLPKARAALKRAGGMPVALASRNQQQRSSSPRCPALPRCTPCARSSAGRNRSS